MINNLITKYKKLKIHKFSKKPLKKYKSLYEQDASNCWLFSAMNELYVNTWLESDIDLLKSEMVELGWDPDKGWKIMVWWLITASQYQDIYEYEIEPFKQIKEFVKLMKAWFAMRMVRRNNSQLKSDIKDNLLVEDVLLDEGWRHAVTIYRDWKYFVELGSWWNKSIYNNFKYTLTSLLWSIKKKTIRPLFYFQFYKNDK